ncbi:DNA polymerase beta domain protein region [Pyrolobus fumarii 1A]|uniref:DNA polymerase beta domain protein region n=1 Tax=Pyrolobus fumarii (strain DSM 11204 / 1A) TaxID=694429 RepID=G0EFZ3_PYRF1|nr:nucleotidyltransferase domain-containing protein [Pyrolobus fumarii]AEM39094.1 DNA polymerase beta domain protein region [Pyrolobus fumarii 1A]
MLAEIVERVRAVLGEAQVYLFGSYARGDWLEDSDIDLIIVSPRFRGLDPGKRYAMIRELLPGDVSLEILLYTPEEFERAKKRSVVVQDAMEYWMRLL